MFPKAMSAVLVLCVGSLACGQTKGPATIDVPIGRVATIPIQVNGEEFQYDILGGDYFDAWREFSTPNELRIKALGHSNGTGWIVVSSVKSGKLQPLFTVRVNVGSGPGPNPVPPGPSPNPDPPKPDPKPDPIVSGKLYVVIVEETRQAVITRGVWFADKSLKAAMDSKGHKWRVVDQHVTNAEGQTPADVKRFIEASAGKSLPLLYLVNESGKTVYSGAAPVEVSRLLELLTKFGG